MKNNILKWVGLLAIFMTILLLLLVWTRWQRDRNLPFIAVVEPAPTSLQALPIMQPREEKKGSSDMLERPVFWNSRKVYVPALAPVKPQAKVKLEPDNFDKVTLLGMYGGGNHLGVIVKGVNGSQRVRVGEDIAGWVLESINPEGAGFSQDGKQRILLLQKPLPATKEELLAVQAEIAEKTIIVKPGEPSVIGTPPVAVVKAVDAIDLVPDKSLESLGLIPNQGNQAAKPTPPPEAKVEEKVEEEIDRSPITFETISERYRGRSK